MKISERMFKALCQLQIGQTTAFGYTRNTNGATYINGNTVKALIKRGLLEQDGEMPWQTYIEGEQLKGKFVPVYKISEAGRNVLMDAGESIQIENAKEVIS